jgi:hypothetical protein
MTESRAEIEPKGLSISEPEENTPSRPVDSILGDLALADRTCWTLDLNQ